jgi:hypothetical protein
MPGGDRTGPRGQGPMTGRGAGYCRGDPTPDFVNRGFGRGRSWGGGGRGWGHRRGHFGAGFSGWRRAGMGWPGGGGPSPAVFSKETEIERLKQQAAGLAEALDQLNSGIRELEKAEPAATPSTEGEDR